MPGPVLRAALQQMARFGNEDFLPGSILELRWGKFGELFQEVAEEALLRDSDDFWEYLTSCAELAAYAFGGAKARVMSEEVSADLARRLIGGDRREKVSAALVSMRLAYEVYTQMSGIGVPDIPSTHAARFERVRDGLVAILGPGDPPVAIAACWALAWIGELRLARAPVGRATLLMLYRLWRASKPGEPVRLVAWAFGSQPLLKRNTFDDEDWGEPVEEFLCRTASDHPMVRRAALVVAWYRGAPSTNLTVLELAAELREIIDLNATTRDLLGALGSPGRRLLEEWNKRDAPRKRRGASRHRGSRE